MVWRWTHCKWIDILPGALFDEVSMNNSIMYSFILCNNGKNEIVVIGTFASHDRQVNA